MAAYWRSPYKEHTSFRNPNHSTLRFEQSLYLSRAKTSVNTARYEWLDMGSNRSSPDRHFSPRYLARSNTAVKGILKVPKRSESSLPAGKDLDTDTSEESTGGTLDSPKKDVKKRVTFGMDTDADPENEEKKPQVNPKRPKCASTALKRISHSRHIEESALKRLNKFLGGGAVEGTSLPSVKGMGISPYSNQSKHSKSSCNHSEDLRCIRCIRKDVEGGPADTFHGNHHTDGKCLLTRSQTSPVKDKEDLQSSGDFNLPDVNKENYRESVQGSFVETFVTNKEDTMTPHQKHYSFVNSSNAKKQYRLLPGRYPFSAGAIQIKKLTALPKRNEENNAINFTPDISVISLNKDSKNAQNTRKSTDLTLESTLKHIYKGASNIRQNESSGRHSADAQLPPVLADSNPIHNNKIDTSVSSSSSASNPNDITGVAPKDKLSSDKASDILDWLNDVHKKQTFQPPHPSAHQ